MYMKYCVAVAKSKVVNQENEMFGRDQAKLIFFDSQFWNIYMYYWNSLIEFIPDERERK